MTKARFFCTAAISLRAKLGLGAALLAATTLLTALILWLGMGEIADRLETALESENRRARYATLSQQAASFLVVATEAVQTDLPAEIRVQRIEPVADRLHATFRLLQADVETAVGQVERLGLDAQSRYGTQSLGLARMEAMLNATLRGLAADTADQARLRAHIDTFASNFDPLLSQAVNTEVLFRNEILIGIDALRARLSRTALIIAGVAVLSVLSFYFGLVRPQFRRLDRLRAAAQEIGRENFAVALPADRGDEIGQLYSETNRMAEALADRQSKVQAEWDRLNQTIAERTEELRAANATLAEIDENRRRFFADVSHELRTPLTVILMEAQIGRQQEGPGQDAFGIIETRAARLNRRIDDLLRVARSESGQLALDLTDVALPDLFAAVDEEVAAEVDNAGMELTLVAPPEIAVDCDPNWIRQVLVSLIRNALRHARSGGQVSLLAEVVADTVEILVIDNGPGISADDQARIFDRFAQGGTGNTQGFGVGLALARWVVEAHGGAISVSSPVSDAHALGDGPGTMITLALPVSETKVAV